MLKRISVALPVVLDKLFDYYISSEIIPEEIDNSLIGKRVLVPFGNSRKLIGVILDESSKESADTLKYAIQIIDSTPIFSDNMIKFLNWISKYYLAPIGEVYKTATPSTLGLKSKIKIKLIEFDKQVLSSKLSKYPSLNKIVSKLIQYNNISTYSNLRKSFPINLHQKLNSLSDLGIIEISEINPSIVKNKLTRFVRINPELYIEKNILENEIIKMEKKAPKRYILMNYLLYNNPQNKFIPISEVIKETNANNSIINSLIKSEVLELNEIEERKTTSDEFKLAHKIEIDIKLTDEQDNVFNNILRKYNSNNQKPSLIYGVTGSGKTLIYMNMIKAVIKNNQSTIVLLPEISLTPQFIDRFELSFPNQISVIHSRISISEREQAYKDIRTGKSKIIIGARSALFAPTQNLGLIIVDEEHDSSFKQISPNPRYNARDCAIMRAKIENSAIILGSATPSIESMYNSSIDKYDLYKIMNRADNAKLPKINVIDMIDASKQGQIYNKTLSKTLLNEIEKRIIKKEGIILLQNRRGFASVVQCQNCGYIAECKNCSVVLTYHKFGDLNKCHYCDYSEAYSRTCPKCASKELKISGSGTQKIEEDIIAYFDDKNIKVSIERMDFDTTSQQGSHRKILERFSKGVTDILIGTQMVAKGLDFDRVTMVGITNADIQLMLPDFRANERTFQLLTQVAGRAGRNSEKEGEVFIQTHIPDNPAIKSVINSSYRKFYDEEIISRQAAFYPPFTRFNVIEFSSDNQQLVIEHSNIFFSLLTKNKSLIIHPPVIPLIEKIREKYRRIIVVKSIKSHDITGRTLHNTISKALNYYQSHYSISKVSIKVDLDANSGI